MAGGGPGMGGPRVLVETGRGGGGQAGKKGGAGGEKSFWHGKKSSHVPGGAVFFGVSMVYGCFIIKIKKLTRSEEKISDRVSFSFMSRTARPFGKVSLLGYEGWISPFFYGCRYSG